MIGVKVFAEGIAKQIKEYLPPEYADVEWQVIETQKNNGVRLFGVNFRMPGQELAPTIYMDSFYNEIRQGKEIDEVMRSIVGVVEESMKVPFKAEEIRLGNYEAIKERLRAALVNSKENRQMLDQMPHIETEDLSLIFRLEFSMQDGCGTGSIKVTNELMKRWGVTVEQLQNVAFRNMQEADPPVLADMESVMEESFLGQKPNNLLENTEGFERDPFEMMYVLTNTTKSQGASAIMCPGVLNQVSQIFPEGFYILPSSVHEVLIVPKGTEMEPQELGKIVREVNRTEVSRADVLSDRVYEYDREKEKICQVPESIERKRGLER